MVNKVQVIIYQATLTKVLPLIFAIPALLLISPWTRDLAIISSLDPLNAFYGLLLIYVGLVFLIEMGFALPETGKSSAGVFGAFLLGGLALGAFVFGGLIITDQYDVINDTGQLNTVLSVLLIIAIFMFVVQAREELFHHKRFSMHSALQRLA